jgi:hypothetical protein
VTYDDGMPDAGGSVIVQEEGTNILGVTLDGNGRWQGALTVNPALQHSGSIVYLDSIGNKEQAAFTQVPLCNSACVSGVLANAPNNELELVITKATGAIVPSLGPVPAPPPPMLLPQTNFSSCKSTPAYGKAPSPTLEPGTDAGVAVTVAAYIITGQTFDCAIQIVQAGTFLLNVRAESPNSNAKLHFEYPVGTKVGTPVSVTQTIPAWGQGNVYKTFPGGSVTLPAGIVNLRIVVDVNGLNLNWLN